MNDANIAPVAAPFETERVLVRPEWIDYNGHMNVAYYIKAFDQAFDELYEMLGFDAATIERTSLSTFTVEMHITYQQEVKQGDRLRITTQLLGFDTKRMHFFQCMYHVDKGYLAATDEWLIMCVDLGTRRVIPIPERQRSFLERTMRAHAGLPNPPEVGRRVSLTSGRPR